MTEGGNGPDGLLRSQSFVRLARTEGISQEDVDLLYKRAARYARQDESSEDNGSIDFVGFVRGDTGYAVPVTALLRIIPLEGLSHVPGGAAHVPGVFAYRGEVLSAHDLAAYLGVSEPHEPSWALIVDFKGQRLGLLADEITNLFRNSVSEVQPVPLTLGPRGSGFQGILRDGTLLVQPKTLLEDPGFLYAFPPPAAP